MNSPAKDPLLGRTIAQRYRLISRLGAGSVARVYLARHVLIDRLSAIKLADPAEVHDPIFRARFLREARAVNRINHPNIVEITDYGEAEGLLYLVMEYVPGESLEQLLARGPIGWRRAAEVGAQIASALGRAHEMGVVHRDLKPANVLVAARRGGDLIKLTDFGVAKLADAAPLTVRAPSGSLEYAAPEQLELGDADARADLFALGVVLHEATSGARPEPGARLSAIAPGTPSFFEEVVSTLLAADPEDRPRDGFEAESLLRRALAASGPEPRRPSPEPPSIPPLPSPESGEAAEPPSIEAAQLDRVADQCDAALAAVEAALAHGRDELAPVQEALEEARKLCATVRAVSDLVGSDTATRERVLGRGRTARAELGTQLDEAAREHSRALGWAGTLAERTYQVEARRLSGDFPVHAVEAMVWEQAALEQEEDRAREGAARLAAEMHAYRAELDRRNERAEREIAVVDACLEGRLAALRSLSLEAWAAVARVSLLASAERPGSEAPG
jgi:serine/threonine-protein kinase